MRKILRAFVFGVAAFVATPLAGQEQDPPTTASGEVEAAPQPAINRSELVEMRREIAAERAVLAQKIEELNAQQERLLELENRLTLALGETPRPSPVRRADAGVQPSNVQPGSQPQAPRSSTQRQASAAGNQPQQPVGVAPEDETTQPEIASLGRQGSAITQKGRLSGDVEWSYARADRNRALFRGVEVVESVLVGVFDINESRQDVFTNQIGLQYGLTSDLEVGIDVPFIARWDTSVLTPVAATGDGETAREIDNSADGFGIGDITLSARKQLHAPEGFGPYIIGNLQVTVPTGTGPFEVARNDFGEATQAATGSGFWSATSGLTAILPSDPGVLFGSISYTKNFGKDVEVAIPPVRVTNVDPGDSLSFSGGIGLALNPQLSLNFGYAHTWGFGTETTTATVSEEDETATQRSRALQAGRFLFGTTFKIDKRTSVNFGLEAGLTDDATDMRAVIRIPFVF